MIDQDKLNEYIENHIDKEPALLTELYRDASVNLLHTNMISGHLQGRILKMFCRMIKPKKVLEIGTFSGYSAICIAEGCPADTEIHTIEIHDELEEFILKYFEKSDYSKNLKLHIGDALNVIPKLDETFDLVFIDGNKRDYIETYNLVFDKVRKGGIIIADNTLWYGKVIEPHKPSETQTDGIKKFNDMLTKDNRIEKVILPVRDGLTLIWKK